MDTWSKIFGEYFFWRYWSHPAYMMACDSDVTICKPLHYTNTMNWKVCGYTEWHKSEVFFM